MTAGRRQPDEASFQLRLLGAVRLGAASGIRRLWGESRSGEGEELGDVAGVGVLQRVAVGGAERAGVHLEAGTPPEGLSSQAGYEVSAAIRPCRPLPLGKAWICTKR